ncbi:hypothetical protein AB0D04_35325 [Streptomyces sp. NPDC048483]|uniref:hypothetical protein n=1 Tax=Streptomyces sp. NPDC048483 TaxID=3154927 RepID=UPI003418E375
MTEWQWMVVAIGGPTGAMGVCAAVAYRIRERARTVGLVTAARAMRPGGTIRYRSLDRQGRATTEWEMRLPPAADRPARERDGRAPGEHGGCGEAT